MKLDKKRMFRHCSISRENTAGERTVKDYFGPFATVFVWSKKNEKWAQEKMISTDFSDPKKLHPSTADEINRSLDFIKNNRQMLTDDPGHIDALIAMLQQQLAAFHASQT